MHSIPMVPETMITVDLLNQFTKERKSIAWVIDEFGSSYLLVGFAVPNSDECSVGKGSCSK
jgi:Mg2+/Co2+ transporter CorB